MHFENNLFLQISALLGITISIAFLVKLLKQPLMIAYIIAGIFSGPLFFNLLRGEKTMYEAFSQFEIVLLLFVLGLNLDFGYLRKIGRISAITGIGQIIFNFVIGAVLLFLLDFPLNSAFYLAMAITFSSTIIITKLLGDKKETESIYGRYTIGLMLVQDIVAILILIFLNALSAGNNGILETILIFSAKGAVLFLALYFISKHLLPHILKRVADHGEFLFLFTITWCFVIASIVYLIGFSVEIGAVAAGLTLGSSPYQSGIVGRIKPLRDFFIILFFIILGSEMGITDFQEIILPGIILSIFILIGNTFILYKLFRLSQFTRRNSFFAGVTAAQVSEFGFVLLFTGKQLGHVDNKTLAVFTFTALTTIFISSYLITYNKKIFQKIAPFFNLFGKDKFQEHNENAIAYDVLIIGYHRIGWKVCDALLEKKVSLAVIDFNPEMIHKLKSRRIPHFFGDVADIDFLETLPLEKCKLIISTLPEYEDQKVFVSYVRKFNKDALLIANLNHNLFLKDLYRAGADYVMMPHLLGGTWIAELLKSEKISRSKLEALKEKQREEMRMAVYEKIIYEQ